MVRKHRAPKGALRLTCLVDAVEPVRICQKAPSAKRCIKLRRQTVPVVVPHCFESESTERQKVH